jgi:glycosyltransferase involved in cell wall biosynthesis
MATNRLAGHKTRVAHVTLGLDMGGQEKLLVEFARHADRARFDVQVVSLGPRGVLAEGVEACGCPVTALEAPAGFRAGLFWTLARWFRRQRIDVVHTHDNRPLIYGAAAARLARVGRVIHTQHGQSLRLSRRQTRLVNFMAGLTDRFVCVSNDSARLAVEQGVNPCKVGMVWNGIDTKRFRFAPNAGGPVVTVGRLQPEKDHDTLIRAAALAARRDTAFRLEIAGDGPCLPRLREVTAELGLEQTVRFLGQVGDVPALLRRSGLFVLPSVSEGVSLTLLEAMASGVAIVATSVGGNPEVVVDGETGLLVPPRDPAALADAFLRLRRDDADRRRLIAAGRERVEEWFDVRRMVADYEAHYAAEAANLRSADTTPTGRRSVARIGAQQE